MARASRPSSHRESADGDSANPTSDNEELVGDSAVAEQYLKLWRPGGPWILTAIDPDAKGAVTATFDASKIEAMRKWIDIRQGKENVYFTVNDTAGPVSIKPKKESIVAARALHVDVDPRPGESLDKEQERILQELRDYRPAPSAIIFSGGGYQAFWILEKPLPIDDPAEVEDRNLFIEKSLQADACHNIDRIMRLPGTINMPGLTKRKKGREPALANIAFATWTRYPFDQFPRWTRKESERNKSSPKGGDANVTNSENGDTLSQHGANPRQALNSYELRAILEGMPNDPTQFSEGFEPPWAARVVWIEIMHAIASATRRAGWARELFVEWSAQFDPDTARHERAWDGLRHEIKAGVSTLKRHFEDFNGEGTFGTIAAKAKIFEARDVVARIKTREDLRKKEVAIAVATLQESGDPKDRDVLMAAEQCIDEARTRSDRSSKTARDLLDDAAKVGIKVIRQREKDRKAEQEAKYAAAINAPHTERVIPGQRGVLISFGPYVASEDGLYRKEKSDHGEPSLRRLCGAIYVLGHCDILHEGEAASPGRLLRVIDMLGNERVVLVTKRDAHATDTNALITKLADVDFDIDNEYRKDIAAYCGRLNPTARVRLIERTGLHCEDVGRVYILPGRTYGSLKGMETHFDAGGKLANRYSIKKALTGPRVVSLIRGHSIPMFCICAAFTPAISAILGGESFGINIYGKSSTGKTATAVAAASMIGNPGRGGKGIVQSWKATENAIEVLASHYSGSLLVLDEMTTADAAVIQSISHTLTSGGGKKRLNRDSSPRDPVDWHVTLLSTSEVSVRDKIENGSGRQQAFAGTENRFIDISADAGKERGIFDECADGGALANAIMNAAHASYGSEFDSFLTELSKHGFVDNDELAIKKSIDEFVARKTQEHGLFGSNYGQAVRTLKRFAVVACAGELAIRFGVLPWDAGEAAAACEIVFDRWCIEHGRGTNREHRQAIEALYDAVTRNVRFFRELNPWAGNTVSGTNQDGETPQGEARLEVWGYSEKTANGLHYYVTGPGFLQIFAAKQLNVKQAVKDPASAGVLRFKKTAGDHGRYTIKKKNKR